jgi:ribosomal-protein-alanine N-acetyltransferase
MKIDIRISIMRIEDLDEVYEIEQKIYPQPWSLNIFRSELERPDKRVYLVARSEGTIVAYAGLMIVDGEGHITNLAIDIPFRKKSIGTMMTLRLIEMARLKKVHWLTLEVRESNKAAQNLYKKFGFRSIGTRKGYYSDGENALIMWTNDIASKEYGELLEKVKEELVGK